METLTERIERQALEMTRVISEQNEITAELLEKTINGLEVIYTETGDSAYEAIDRLKKKLITTSKPYAISIVCTGWAVAIEENENQDTPPSKHPNRVRVAIATAQTASSAISRVEFADKREGITTNEGKGELQEALARTLKHLTRKHETHLKRTQAEI